jgi:hypothetical protein
MARPTNPGLNSSSGVQASSSLFSLIASVLSGLLLGLDFNFVGRITGAELVVGAFLPIMWLMGDLPRQSWPIGRLLSLAGVWLLAQMVSDVANGTEADDMMRGAARAFITMVLLAGYFGIVQDRLENIVLTFLSMAFGLLIGYWVEPSDFAQEDPWKFGYGLALTMIGLVAIRQLFWRSNLNGLAFATCLALSAIHLAMGFRSMAAIVFLTGIMSMLSVSAEHVIRRWSNLGVLACAVAMMASVAGLTEFYSEAAQSGLLGVREQEKFLSQVSERGVLLSGRAEILVSSQAIMARPLLGYGSWARNEYFSDLYQEVIGLGGIDTSLFTGEAIPSHSHLFGAWVEGGIGSALLWLYVMGFLVPFGALTILRERTFSDPVVVFSLLYLSWAVMFSPYGLQNRPLSCFCIVAVVTVLRLSRSRQA